VERLDIGRIRKMKMNVSAWDQRRMLPVEHSLSERKVVGPRARATKVPNAAFRDRIALA
jgi:hypothetical protein